MATKPKQWKESKCRTCGQTTQVLNPSFFRWIRTKMKMTQRAVADLFGTTPQYVSQIEKGERACAKAHEVRFIRKAKDRGVL